MHAPAEVARSEVAPSSLPATINSPIASSACCSRPQPVIGSNLSTRPSWFFLGPEFVIYTEPYDVGSSAYCFWNTRNDVEQNTATEIDVQILDLG
jgi:hypothetical protein